MGCGGGSRRGGCGRCFGALYHRLLTRWVGPRTRPTDRPSSRGPTLAMFRWNAPSVRYVCTFCRTPVWRGWEGGFWRDQRTRNVEQRSGSAEANDHHGRPYGSQIVQLSRIPLAGPVRLKQVTVALGEICTLDSLDRCAFFSVARYRSIHVAY